MTTYQCEDCGATPAVNIRKGDCVFLLCAKCIQDHAIWDASLEHAKDLITDAFNDWLDAWAGNEAYRNDFSGLFAQLTTNVQAEVILLKLLAQRRIFPPRDFRGD